MKETYPAFITTGFGGNPPRVPISAERIVIVLGTDEKTGLPLELSIHLEKKPDNSVAIYAINESTPTGPWPNLAVEQVLAVNSRRVRVVFETMRPKADSN